jgi:hypothetical protein
MSSFLRLTRFDTSIKQIMGSPFLGDGTSRTMLGDVTPLDAPQPIPPHFADDASFQPRF